MKVDQTIHIQIELDNLPEVHLAEHQARELLAQLLRIFPQEARPLDPSFPPPFNHPAPYICPPPPYTPYPGTTGTGDPAPWLHWPTTTICTASPVWGQSPSSEDEQAISQFLNKPKQP